VEITGPVGQLFSSESLYQPAPASGNHDPLPNTYDLALHPLPPEERTMAVSALEAIHLMLPQVIQHVTVSPDGRIVLTTDFGTTVRISPDSGVEEQWRIVQTSPSKRSRHIIFENSCLSAL
jgi:hypothetical protein